MSRPPQHVVFLHGLGAGPASWDHQIDRLPAGFAGWAPTIPGLSDLGTDPFTLDGAVASVCEDVDERGLRAVHLCGLSLGAMVALRMAILHPERVQSLTLSGGQARPPRWIMQLQQRVFAALPARVVGGDDRTKAALLQVMAEVSGVDMRPDLASVQAPTRVVCGRGDWPNRPAARMLARSLPQAEARLLTGGHELNTERPGAFSAVLNSFLVTTR